MIGFALLALLAALLAAPAAGAQDQAASGNQKKAASGAQDQTAPQEPEIVLPEVILRIEDFSVERLSGAAPGGEESLPPARELPLPAGEAPQLAEPPAPPAEGPEGQPQASQRALSATAELGAGTSNHLFSQVALNSSGTSPRFSLRFLHETLDGLAGEPAGSGYDSRKEELEGALKLGLGKASLALDGSLHEQDRGLQQQSAAVESRLVRTGTLGTELAWPFAEHWTLTASANGSFAGELLTVPSGTASELEELKASPRLSLEVRTPRFWLAVEGRYGYELYERQQANRAGALARFGVEISKAARLEGSGGWHWSQFSSPEHLFPFDLSLTLTPNSYLSVVASGGYRVEELDLRQLAEDDPWVAFPASLLDDHGWFADFTATFSLQRSFSLQAALNLDWPRAAPWPGTSQDASGLYPLDQQAAGRAAVETSLRWTPARDSYLTVGWHMEMAQYPDFSPGNQLWLEGGLASAKWGAHGSLRFATGYLPTTPDFTEVPELSLGGAFFQASTAVRLTAELEDLLSFLCQGGQRPDWPPFLAPGIRGTFKVQINL
jgi:hypothetical protein